MPYAKREDRQRWDREKRKPRIRIRAGGIQFHVGYGSEAHIKHLRQKIKEDINASES